MMPGYILSGALCRKRYVLIQDPIPVLDSQPAGDRSHKPGGRLLLLSAKSMVTFATAPPIGRYQIILIGESHCAESLRSHAPALTGSRSTRHPRRFKCDGVRFASLYVTTPVHALASLATAKCRLHQV